MTVMALEVLKESSLGVPEELPPWEEVPCPPQPTRALAAKREATAMERNFFILKSPLI